MKFNSHIIGFATFGMVAATAASAQSSVALYGLMDAGVNYLSNAQTGRNSNGLVGHSQYSFQEGGTGGQSGSRWGLLGSEDLGGGMSAVFQLENGFSLNNGTLAQGGAEWGRQAYVGLKSNAAGTITLGRQYDSLVSFVQPFTAAVQWAGYISAHPGDVDNLLNTRRINNAIKYTSPVFNGISFGGLYSLGGAPGSVGKDQIWSLGAGYISGPVSLGVGYINARNPNFSFYGSIPSAGTTLTSNNIGSLGSATTPESNPAIAGYASANTTQIIAAGAAYQLGAATLGMTYSNTQFRGLGSIGSSGPNPFGYSGTVTFNNAEANFKYQITPAFLAGVAYNYTHSTGSDGLAGATYHQASTGTDYFLSKRTDLYAIVVYQHANGTDSLDQPAVATITGQTPSSNNHQIALRIGMRHRF